MDNIKQMIDSRQPQFGEYLKEVNELTDFRLSFLERQTAPSEYSNK